jgi:diaminohydroxyphosphoribosylaminopyrimidine deaminase/5-amino-6-(5-phosphoribosylamino)uracil reductase
MTETTSDVITDSEYMARALRLADLGRYTTTPNPRVGCVLVRDGQVLAEGWHHQAGEPHAERVAMANAGQSVQGATAYVTLEPCHHQGRTGPCSRALIDAGVKRVVVAMEDPNPKVSGRGLAALRAAGVEVCCGLMSTEARALNRGFVARMERGRPFVFAKLAASLDGRTAMADGESKWITGVAARRQVQQLRASSCAIVTGIETVLKDDPALTVRADILDVDYPDATIRQPLRVVLDSRLRMPLNARILEQAGHTVIITGVDDAKRLERFSRRERDVVVLPLQQGKIDLQALLAWLVREHACNEVMIEAGATLAGAFLAQGLLDELQLFVAPTLLGSGARPLLQLPLVHIGDQQRLEIEDVRSVGDDWWLRARPK